MLPGTMGKPEHVKGADRELEEVRASALWHVEVLLARRPPQSCQPRPALPPTLQGELSEEGELPEQAPAHPPEPPAFQFGATAGVQQDRCAYRACVRIPGCILMPS